MADASLQPIEIVRSEQEKVSWLRALLRRKRKNDGKSRVVVFVNTEESALALHAALRKSFTVAVNAGPHAAEGLVAFREGRRLVLITRDGQQPPGHLCSTGAATGAVAVSWEAPSSLGAHRARMKTAAGIQLCYQLLVLRHGSSFVPSMDPAYAHALLLSTMLAGKAAPRALQEAAAARDHTEPTSAGEKRRRAAAPTQSFVFYHGTSTAKAQMILARGFKPSPGGCLGAGVYVADDEKAGKFARDRDRHKGDVGARLKVRVSMTSPKFVSYDYQTWQAEGHDACRAECTSLSSHKEWCLKRSEQVEVMSVERLAVRGSVDSAAPSLGRDILG